jgi:hypothetical protein
MFKLIETLRSKPSDKNIRIIRFLFASILTGVLVLGMEKSYFEFAFLPKELLYVLFLFPVIGLVRSILDPGVMRKKLWKWTQVTLGGILMILSIFFIETDTRIISGDSPLPTLSGEVSAVDLANQVKNTKSVLDMDFWIGFLGFILLLGGLIFASKNVTTKNERFGEKVTKIRV